MSRQDSIPTLHPATLPEADDVVSVTRARTLETFGSLLLQSLARQGVVDAMFAASLAWPDDMLVLPTPGADFGPCEVQRASAAVLLGRDRPGLVPLAADGQAGAVFLMLASSRDGLPRACAPLLDAANRRAEELLTWSRLNKRVNDLSQAEQLQKALFAIADMAGSDLPMPTMLRELHAIIGRLMYAENFFIGMYDAERDSLRFLLFADTVDHVGPSMDGDIPLERIRDGITWYLIRDGKPLMGSTQQIAEQVSGELDTIGADSLDMLGVPMKRDGKVRGVIAVQSYLQGGLYTDRDRALLSFVAEHVLTAVERKQSQEELERRVADRTRELAESNVVLHQQVLERERAEHLQGALYRIAALAHDSELADEEFYRGVHSIVGELINAQNFYIALLSEDGTTLEFPYSVDSRETSRPTRLVGRGLTEYVLRNRVPMLLDADGEHALEAQGEVQVNRGSAPSVSWLGVPLMSGQTALGVVAVQSYTPEMYYHERDAELLVFVSSQIANSLQRRRGAEALRKLNAELEQRVQMRTRELREQIVVREKIEAQLKHQVMHDSLTGLPNRLYLHDRLEREIAGLRRNAERRFALLYLDVDRFKLFNDSLGHLAGDDVLREVARRLASCVREPDIVARLSGDEFAILMVDMRDSNAACRVAQRVQECLQIPMQVAGRELQTSASIGIAIGDARYESIDAILHDADVALYRAKAAGRQRFVLFDDSLQRAAMDVLGMEHELRAALHAQEFVPYFQPLVRLDDSSTIGYEALIRWNHPTRGILTPDKFLSVAEDSGLLEAMDWQMYRAACKEAVPLVDAGGFITLNISPRHFQNEEFDSNLIALTADTGFDPAKLRIEVTEGTLLGDPESVAKILERLRAACVEAALDDFGTGYSSLGYVHQFPLKMIKIDRSFIDPLGSERSQRSAAVVGAILALAHSLGVEVVAEGIETEAQRRALVQMGCIYGQGFLFGRPQPASHWLPAP